jgi:hypothetical protein
VLAAFALAGLPLIARAAPVPDSVRLEELRTACRSWNRVRVSTANESFEFSAPSLDSGGVLREKPQRRPAIQTPAGSDDVPSRTIGWAEIERIECGESHSGSGLAQGLIVGGIVGFSAFFIAASNSTGEDYTPAGYVPLGLLIGGGIGASLGGHASHWTTLYP